MGAGRGGQTSYAGFWVMRRSGGVVFRHVDDLDAVVESDTCDELGQHFYILTTCSTPRKNQK